LAFKEFKDERENPSSQIYCQICIYQDDSKNNDHENHETENNNHENHNSKNNDHKNKNNDHKNKNNDHKNNDDHKNKDSDHKNKDSDHKNKDNDHKKYHSKNNKTKNNHIIKFIKSKIIIINTILKKMITVLKIIMIIPESNSV
jgi:hypothetical protein